MNTSTGFPVPDYPSKFAPSYWELVGHWMDQVISLRLRSTYGTADFPAEDSALASHVWEQIDAATQGFDVWARRYGMTDAQMDERVWEKAAWHREHFQPPILQRSGKRRFKRAFTAAECARGGSHSKRSMDQKLVSAFVRLQEELTATGEVLKVTQIAARLHCSERQVYRLRALVKTTVLDLTPTSSVEALVAETFPEMTDAQVDAEFARLTDSLELAR